jgi:hypothetical protein
MDTKIQIAIIIILHPFIGLGALYASWKGHMGYADALLGTFVLMLIYLAFLGVKDILSYEYDWTDKEIAKMNEDTENAK